MRKALVGVLDRAIEAGQSVQADKRSGQMGLFGGPAEDDGTAASPHEPSIGTEEWSESEMLKHEKDTLGYYITSHPLAQHRDTLEFYRTAQICELPEIRADAQVTLGGMVTKVRTVVTRSGRNAGSKMGIVTVEDLSGAVEVVVFAGQLEQYRSLIVPERIVFVRGSVDKKRDEPSVRVNELIAIEDAPEVLAAEVLIRVHGAESGREQLERIKEIVGRFPGDKPMRLELVTPNRLRVTIRCKRARVAASREFVAEIKDAVGSAGIGLLPPPTVTRSNPAPRRRPPAPRPSEKTG
jgi:DNA polymerase-3 subunit alpha